MIKIRRKSNKLVISILLIAIMLVGCITLYLQTDNNKVYAESELRDNGVYSKLTYNVYANKRHIGVVNIIAYLRYFTNGNFVLIAEANVIPKTNDGTNKYQVEKFAIDIRYADAQTNNTLIATKNNSSQAIVNNASNGGQIMTFPNSLTSFNISANHPFSTNYGKINIVENNLETEQGYLNRRYVITPKNVTHSSSYTASFAFLFKNNYPYSQSAMFYVELNTLNIKGLVFAPNYEENNSNMIRIAGSSNTMNSTTTGPQENNESDKHPNDYLSYIDFIEYTW